MAAMSARWTCARFVWEASVAVGDRYIGEVRPYVKGKDAFI